MRLTPVLLPMYERQAFLDGQWWLPLTAQLSHLSPAHALANALAAVLLWRIFAPWLRWQPQALALGGGALAVAVGVVLDTDCLYYAGASGALHGLAAGGAVALLCQPPSDTATEGAPTWRSAPALGTVGVSPQVVAWLLLVGLGLKLVWQAWPLGWGASDAVPDLLRQDAWTWGFPVYQRAHALGSVGGVAAVGLGRLLSTWLARCRPAAA